MDTGRIYIGVREKSLSDTRSLRQGYNTTKVLRRRMPLPPLLSSENDTDIYNRYENLKFSLGCPRLPYTLTSLSFSVAPVYFKKMWKV